MLQGNSYILTSTKQLQKQYLNSLMGSMLNVEETAGGEAAGNRPTADDTPLSDESAAYFADTIADKTILQYVNYDNIEYILDNENLSQEDIVKIVKSYDDKHGALLSTMCYGVDAVMNKDAINEMTDILVEQAKAGNTDAINILAENLHASGTTLFGSIDYFTERFFETVDSRTLACIVQAYPSVNDKANISDDFPEGAINTGKYKDLLDKIKDARALL